MVDRSGASSRTPQLRQRPAQGSGQRAWPWIAYVVIMLLAALFALAFRGFGTKHVSGLFLPFAAGLLLGVVGPVYFMVWRRGRSLADLGIRGHRLRESLALGAVLAAVQFAMTLPPTW